MPSRDADARTRFLAACSWRSTSSSPMAGPTHAGECQPSSLTRTATQHTSAGRAPSPRPAAARSAHGLQLPVHDEPGNRPAVVEPNLGRVPELVSDPDPRIGVLLGGLPEASVRAHRRRRIVALLPSGKVGLQVWNLTRSVPKTRAMTVAAAAPSTACAESWSGSAGWCRAGSSPSQPWTIRVHRSWASSFGEAHSLGTAGRVGECG